MATLLETTERQKGRVGFLREAGYLSYPREQSAAEGGPSVGALGAPGNKGVNSFPGPTASFAGFAPGAGLSPGPGPGTAMVRGAVTAETDLEMEERLRGLISRILRTDALRHGLELKER